MNEENSTEVDMNKDNDRDSFVAINVGWEDQKISIGGDSII